MHRDESIVENAALTWVGERRYAVGDGPQIASGRSAALMYKALLRQNTEFLLLPSLCALRVSVFPILTPLLPKRGRVDSKRFSTKMFGRLSKGFQVTEFRKSAGSLQWTC